MRLTLRAVLAMMSAVESTLDEICTCLRPYSDPTYRFSVEEARKQQRKARQALAAVLDRMIESGEGESK